MARGGFKTDRQKAYAAGDFSKLRGSQPRIEVTGQTELMKTLTELSEAHGKSVERSLAKRALKAGLKPLTTAIKREAPTTSRFRTTGKRKKKAARMTSVRKAVGSSAKKNKRRNVHEAKAGLNVGPAKGRMPHAALFTIGTKRRSTRAGLNRGRMVENRFVDTGRKVAEGAVGQAMLFSVAKNLPAEVERVRKRHEKRQIVD